MRLLKAIVIIYGENLYFDLITNCAIPFNVPDVRIGNLADMQQTGNTTSNSMSNAYGLTL